MALVACPTRRSEPRPAAVPPGVTRSRHVVDDVTLRLTSEASFGAWAYLIVRSPEQGGNVLVDSPRFTTPLVKRIEKMGGVSLMFLSHRDDIADHAKFAAHFHCPRVMHEGTAPPHGRRAGDLRSGSCADR